MPTIPYRASSGAMARCELADGRQRPALVILRAADGTWLLRRQADGGKPTYVQIDDADVAAFHRLADRYAAAEAKPKGPPAAWPPLAPTALRLLRALRAKGATRESKAAGRAAIAEKARVGHFKSDHVVLAFADLRRRGLIESKKHVGTWLTKDGSAAAAATRNKEAP